MRRLFLFLAQITLIISIHLLVMALLITVARRQEPTQWFYYGTYEHLYRADINGTVTEIVDDSPVPFLDLPFEVSEDGRYLYYTTQDSVYNTYANRLNLAMGVPHRLTNANNYALFITNDLHNNRMYYYRFSNQANDGIYRLNFSIRQTEMLVPNVSYYNIVAWAENRKWLVYWQNNASGRDLIHFDIETRQATVIVANGSNNFFITISPDEEWLYYTTDSRLQLSRYHLENGDTENFLDEANYFLDFWGWNADGEWMLFASNIIIAFNPAEGTILNLTDNPYTYEEQVFAWSHDRDWIYFQSNRDAEYRYAHLYRVQPDGSSLQHLVDIEKNILSVHQSPDHQWVLLTTYIGTQYKLWKISLDDSDPILLLENEGFIIIDSWSPDEKWMIIRQHKTEGEAFYRLSLEDKSIKRLTDFHDYQIFMAWSYVLDSYWNPILIIILGVLMLVGGCLTNFRVLFPQND